MLDRPLSSEEVRALGVLVEKQLSTPDYYPMTLNALRQACNQKTNRDPVVDYDESVVREALDGLHRLRLAGIASGASSRAEKYRHALAEVFGLDVPALAVLASLLVRGPQTTGELRARTSRMHDFEDTDAVEAVLQRLANQEPPLATELERQPGQKEARYAHLLAGEPEITAPAAPAPAPAAGTTRLGALEDEVAQLRDDLDALREAFEAFREQFE